MNALRLSAEEAEGWVEALQRASVDENASDTTWHLSTRELRALVQDAQTARRLHDLVNTPELVDFAKAVHLEAVHQEQRWGTADRQGKGPYQWYWLLSHLATRALEHHKEAERLLRGAAHTPSVAYHREKAAHHTITAAAMLAHWHASVVGAHTAMQPGHSASAAEADKWLGENP